MKNLVIQLKHLLKQLRLETIPVAALHRAEGIEALPTAVEADMPNDEVCPLRCVDENLRARWHRRMRAFLGLASAGARETPWRPTVHDLDTQENDMMKKLANEVSAVHAAHEAQREDDEVMTAALAGRSSTSNATMGHPMAAGVDFEDEDVQDVSRVPPAERRDELRGGSAANTLASPVHVVTAVSQAVEVGDVGAMTNAVVFQVRVRLPKAARTEIKNVATQTS